MNGKIRVVCIAGPTASGKTALGVYLAEKFGGEIVSADSMQIYKGMPIASAVPDSTEKRGIKHHLMEFAETDETFTVARYVALAKDIISDIANRGKLPIIVGGTGLYIDSLLNNIVFAPKEDNPELRRKLTERAEEIGYGEMLEELRKIDPISAEKLHPNDKKRIIRALEIYAESGITKSEQNVRSRLSKTPYDVLFLGLTCADRENLYKRINDRVDNMIGAGLIEEARKAYKERSQGGAAFAIGHKEFFDYFDGKIPLETAVQNLKQSTRRYAKRQLTWFRKNEKIHWLFSDTEDVFERAEEILREEGL